MYVIYNVYAILCKKKKNNNNSKNYVCTCMYVCMYNIEKYIKIIKIKEK